MRLKELDCLVRQTLVNKYFLLNNLRDLHVSKVYEWHCYSVLCLVAQLCPILWDPLDCSPAGLSMGILQARILEWVAMPSSRGSSQPRDQTQVSRIASRFFTSWVTREAHCIFRLIEHKYLIMKLLAYVYKVKTVKYYMMKLRYLGIYHWLLNMMEKG